MIPWERDEDFALQDPEGENMAVETIIKEALPAQWRKVVYATYAVLGVVIGGAQVGFAAAEAGQPVWLTVTLAVYAFVGGAVGLTATSHTPKSVESLGIGGIEEPPVYVHPGGGIDDDPGPEALNIPEHESVVTRPPSDLGVDQDDIEPPGDHAAEVD